MKMHVYNGTNIFKNNEGKNRVRTDTHVYNSRKTVRVIVIYSLIEK